MNTKVFYISFLTLLVTILMLLAISSRGNPVVVKTNLENLPMAIAGFKATEDTFSQSVYDELNADKNIYRHYSSEDGRRVDLYIGYYGTAKGGRTKHNPYACLPGGGWGIVESNKVELKTAYYRDGVYVNYILAKDGSSYQVMLHWYQSDGYKVLSGGIQQNIQRFIGKVFYGKNDGAFVRVTVLTHESGTKKARKTAIFFAERILSLLPEFWPEEK